MKINRKLIAALTLTISYAGHVNAETYSERHERRHEEAKDGASNFGRALAVPFTAAGDAVTLDQEHFTRQNIDAMKDNADDMSCRRKCSNAKRKSTCVNKCMNQKNK